MPSLRMRVVTRTHPSAGTLWRMPFSTRFCTSRSRSSASPPTTVSSTSSCRTTPVDSVSREVSAMTCSTTSARSTGACSMISFSVLARERPVEALDHRVECAGQVLDLVVGAAQRDAFVQSTFGDRCGRDAALCDQGRCRGVLDPGPFADQEFLGLLAGQCVAVLRHDGVALRESRGAGPGGRGRLLPDRGDDLRPAPLDLLVEQCIRRAQKHDAAAKNTLP